MAKQRETIGVRECLTCKHEVPVKKSDGGAVSVSCPWCDLSAYAKPGTQAFKIIMEKVRLAAPEPGPEPEARPAQEPDAPGTATPIPPKKKGGGLPEWMTGAKA